MPLVDAVLRRRIAIKLEQYRSLLPIPLDHLPEALDEYMQTRNAVGKPKQEP